MLSSACFDRDEARDRWRASHTISQMTSRKPLLIIAASVCHLILPVLLVTRQLPAQQSAPASPPASTSQTPCVAQDPSPDATLICSTRQEKDGPLYKLTGDAEVHYASYVLRADTMTYNSDTGEATADGHFSLDGGPSDEHIRASHGVYNFTLETGKFYDVTGTAGLHFTGNRVILTSTAPFAFSGKLVEKDSPEHYIVSGGSITTCQLPHPLWQFKARKIVVNTAGNATIYRSAFFLHDVPVLYFPFVTYPVNAESRKSGFLAPALGNSNSKGFILGDAYYWALNRSMDATIGAEYFSKRGWAQHGEFRAQPSAGSYLDLNYFGVLDRGIGSPPVKQGGENARLNAASSFHGYRAVANIDYLTSYLFRLAFNEVFSQAVYSEVKSQAFLSKSENGFSFNLVAERYQNFQSTTAGDVVRITHAPMFEVSGADRPLFHTPLFWSFDASAGGLARSEPGFQTGNLLGRLDFNPQVSLPLLLRGWSVRPEITLHGTVYGERMVGGTGMEHSVNDPIQRRAFEGVIEVRPPAISRVFEREWLGRKWKHVLEPRIRYRYVTGINNFLSLLHFDERDILANTNEVEYGMVNRLYARSRGPRDADCGTRMTTLLVGGPAAESTVPWEHRDDDTKPCQPGPAVHEVATWEIAQKYFLDPTFGGALVAGQRNVFTTTNDLTGIAFATQARHLSPIVSRLRVETSARTDAEWDLDYDFQQGRINASTLLANYHIGEFTLGAGDAFLQIPQPNAPTAKFQQFRTALGYGHLNKRGFSAATTFALDTETSRLQFGTAQTSYNWNCCGLTLEYRRYSIANVRNENLFRFNFTLANIGAFGNLHRQERLY